MLEVRHITKQYTVKNQRKGENVFTSVDDISLKLKPDSSYALIGESGSGKSTLAMMMAAVLPPTHGEILMDGKDIWKLTPKERRRLRGDLQLVLQNSKGALDPRKTVYQSIEEPLKNLCQLSREEQQRTIYEIVEKVQLEKSLLTRKPNELSGGQQSRVCIARAMCLSPKFVIFDESVSGLDVTVQKKVLDLLLELRKEFHGTYLFITHDIDVALYMSDHIFVMKEGHLLDEVQNALSYDAFQHPYSRELIASLPPKSPHYRL
ncbi:ABC transporter ATP-binding protein [Anaerotignum sp. MB30-C6]|uniref:ABC transporter ATP-binding protein n=1 Tax=Anaerotignum sp. MB30-C6 TaxID=3070814 RepID=UPI0027DCBFD8|nr:dipeptide/oligopeptide/nickel ABC transporter ATP-binding protein [Anaerotignum sp. MB30-C6]WMI80086.1 dipeptide/oligopeptide/nickel ABC transporter ATP-binding protein [Anaerotignum sp. MB30-C6]